MATTKPADSPAATETQQRDDQLVVVGVEVATTAKKLADLEAALTFDHAQMTPQVEAAMVALKEQVKAVAAVASAQP